MPHPCSGLSGPITENTGRKAKKYIEILKEWLCFLTHRGAQSTSCGAAHQTWCLCFNFCFFGNNVYDLSAKYLNHVSQQDQIVNKNKQHRKFVFASDVKEPGSPVLVRLKICTPPLSAALLHSRGREQSVSWARLKQSLNLKASGLLTNRHSWSFRNANRFGAWSEISVSSVEWCIKAGW